MILIKIQEKIILFDLYSYNFSIKAPQNKKKNNYTIKKYITTVIMISEKNTSKQIMNENFNPGMTTKIFENIIKLFIQIFLEFNKTFQK